MITPFPENRETAICTPDEADQAIGEIKAERERRDLFIEAAEAGIARLKAQIEAEKERCERCTQGWLGLLSAYLETVPARQTKTQKSFSLPSGKLVRKLSRTVMQPDEEKLLAYAKKNAPEFLERKETCRWGEIKKELAVVDGQVVRTTTGEILDCVDVFTTPDTFDIA